MALKLPPIPLGAEFESGAWIFWFETVQRYLEILATNFGTVNQKALDPSIVDVPRGQSAIWKNTTTGQVRLWTNDGGVMKSVLLS